jgi:hypothetical protein
VFEEACRQCDAKKMHLQLLSIFERGEDPQATIVAVLVVVVVVVVVII